MLMLRNFSLNDTRQMDQWDQYVRSHPRGTPFHASGWLETIRKTYKYNPVLYACFNEGNEMNGIFPSFHIKSFLTGNRVVSIPFSDYGGPLFSGHNDTDRIASIIDNFRKCRSFEIRSDLNGNSGFSFHNHYIYHVLDLTPGPDALMKSIDRKTTRYSIRKAEKIGVHIEKSNTLEGMKEFYHLNVLTRKKHGLPPQPFAFFLQLQKNLVSRDEAFILLASHEGKNIGAGLFLKFRETVYFKYSASDPEHLAQKSPNHLLTWRAIVDACENGFKYLDFGRTSSSNPGLAKYKEMWGAKPVELPYYYYPNTHSIKPNTEDELSYRMITRICRHLPESWLVVFGSLIYRHIG